MKRHMKMVVVLIAMFGLVFLLNRCGSKEEPGTQTGKTQIVDDAQKKVTAKKTGKTKSVLPKRVLALDLTDEQITALETAYNEIFTPEIQAKKIEMYRKLKTLPEGSEESKNLRQEISATFAPYNTQFRKKLRKLLTKEQKAIYFRESGKKKASKEK
jgi:hypothetical protein